MCDYHHYSKGCRIFLLLNGVKYFIFVIYLSGHLFFNFCFCVCVMATI